MQPVVAFVSKRLSLAVVAVCTVVMVLVFITVESGLQHLGTYGIAFVGDTDRIDVAAGSAGGVLQSGDRIDLSSLTPEQRFALGAFADTIDSQTTVRVIRGTSSFPLTLKATRPYYGAADALVRQIGTPVCFFVALGLATALFLMRPSGITLTFYLYTILMLLKINEDSLDLAQWPLNVAVGLATQVIYPLTNVMILVFAKWLYGVPSRTWSWIFGTTIAIAVVDFAVWTDPLLWLTFGAAYVPLPMHVMQNLADMALATAVLIGLAYIASGATGVERVRANWLVAGIALSPILDFTWALTTLVGTYVVHGAPALLAVGQWSNALLPWAGMIGVAFVTYGFLAKRIVDIRLAISRAAVYGAAILVMVAVFGSVEWLADEIFESTRPAEYVSLVVALAVGFFMRAIDQRFEDFLGHVFFRDQREAENAMRRAARALANTSSESTLLDFLIDEPVRVLKLTSSALFLARDGGAFARVAARGWSEHELAEIDEEDPLVVQLRTEGAAINLEAWRREGLNFPQSTRAPAIAIPLVMRGTVFGIAFYGDKGEGGRLSASEMQLLEAIATSAAAAYDHIDAERSRKEIAELKERLGEAGILPARGAAT